MSTTPNIPMFDPTGQVRMVPSDQAASAAKAGGKFAVKMQAPDNSMRWVPRDQYDAAVKAGGKMVPSVGGDVKPLTEKQELETTFPVGEKGESLGENVHNIARDVFTGAYSVLAHPLKTAGSAISSLVPGTSTPNPIQGMYQGLNTRPGETIATTAGQAAATAGLSKVAGPAVKSATKPFATSTAVALQELSGAGKEPVELARQSHEAATVKSQEVFKERTDAALKKSAEEKKQWVQDTMEFKRQQAKAQAVAAKKEVINRGKEAISDRAVENAKDTFKTVKTGLDTRWNNLRQQIGEMPIRSSSVSTAIEEAKQQYLMGAPESLKQFNDLTRQMEGEGMLDTPQGITPMPRTLTWQEGRTHYSALTDKMYSGELPGNVWKAVDHVREALDKELTETAKVSGKGREYASVKKDWSQFKKDWDDMSNLDYSKSAQGEAGSPLARLVRSSNTDAAGRVLSDDRLVQQLARYQQHGANLNIPRAFRGLEKSESSLEKVTVPKEPERPGAPSMPKAPKETPSPTPAEIRSKKLLEFAGRPYNTVGRIINPAHTILKSARLRKWVAEQTRKEITSIQSKPQP